VEICGAGRAGRSGGRGERGERGESRSAALSLTRGALARARALAALLAQACHNSQPMNSICIHVKKTRPLTETNFKKGRSGLSHSIVASKKSTRHVMAHICEASRIHA